MSVAPQIHESTFRPRARLLQLLGDQLIGSARLAVFELVKNSYDADAENVSVTLAGIDTPSPEIIVEDDGEGMTLETILNVWMVPGHEYRELQRKRGERSKKFHRLPLGEKGLGRFAVHKLGDEIELLSRHADSNEVLIRINWAEIIAKPFLSEAPIHIEERPPQHFTDHQTGTRITVRKLRQKTWSRGDVRRLQRQITSISSPFEEPGSFKPLLVVPDHESWLEGIPTVQEILDRAIWRFSFRFENGLLSWKYEFTKIPGVKLEGRRGERNGDRLLLPTKGERGGPDRKKVVADAAYQNGVGPISGEFYVYDRDRELMRLLTETKLFTDYLDENGGIRVYRDGIRVYNYGEPGDDWLGLDLRRVNTPTRNISRNIVIGAVHLQLGESNLLIEKTNREGFVEGDALQRLKNIILGVLVAFEAERQKDKQDIRSLTGKGSDPELDKIRKPLEELRAALDREGVRGRVERYLVKIETDYQDMQQTLLHAGMSGMNLALVFHEVERGVRTLHSLIQRGESVNTLEEQSRDLTRLLDGFATILRKDQRGKYKASSVIKQTRKFSALRFAPHRIALEAPILEKGEHDFEAVMSFGLVVSALGSPLPDTALAPVRPQFTELVPVHSDYIGGKFYFEDSQIPDSPAAFVFKPVSENELEVLLSDDRRRFKAEECLTHDRVAGLRSALLSFITAGCLRRIQDEQAQRRPKRFAFLFHTAAVKAAHAWQESVILQFDEKLHAEALAASETLRKLIQAAYDDLAKSLLASSQTIPAFSEVHSRVLKALTGGELMITKVNSEAQVAALLDDEGQLKLRTPLNIFIGGQILDRGITIANLIGFYYGRNPKKFQQDTVMQHSRMYGFRPPEDRAVTRFYTAPHIHRAMQRMHEADSALRDRIEANGGDQLVHFIELDSNGQIVPCGNQKILASNITTLRAGRRILPVGFQTDFKTRLRPITEGIDALLKTAGHFPKDGEAPLPYEVPLELACEIIDRLGPTFVEFGPGYEDRWDPAEYKAILKHLSDNSRDLVQKGKVLLLVRTGRNLNRIVKSTSHAEFADAPDTTRTEGNIARAAAINIPVLMMIRQNGAEAQEWRGCPFWWPVIMTPATTRTTLFAHGR